MDGVDDSRVDVSINDGVDTRECNAASGVTTSGTTGNFAAAVPRGKRCLRDGACSSDFVYFTFGGGPEHDCFVGVDYDYEWFVFFMMCVSIFY